MSYAPVVLFVYNRIDHVEKCLESLCRNDIAKETALFIFSDGPRRKEDEKKVEEVRELIQDEKYSNTFQSVHIMMSQTNNGLAKSIITGVDQIIHKYGKVIVIEDDNICSNDFLAFMNDCLVFYENNKKIWSIGGYSPNLRFPRYYHEDVYLMGRTCSYAWASWLDRWEKVDWDVSDYFRFKYDFVKRYRFNRYGSDRSRMLDEQQLGKKNSWAIRFCYAMFTNNMYTVWPVHSKIRNIGYDVGTHVDTNNKRDFKYFDVSIMDDVPYKLSNDIIIDENIRKEFIKPFRRSVIHRVIAYCCNLLRSFKFMDR